MRVSVTELAGATARRRYGDRQVKCTPLPAGEDTRNSYPPNPLDLPMAPSQTREISNLI